MVENRVTQEEDRSRKEEGASSPTLPKLTVSSFFKDIFQGVYMAIFDARLSPFATILVMIVESVALKVIINKVAYTEIDFTTYMQQVKLISDGELDYKQIFGDTGDLVYPAGHVQVYQFLSWASNGGQDFGTLQDIFRYLYLATHAITFALYYLCLGESEIRPWAIYLLSLSKRLHSIYVLRLFNDCFTSFASLGTVLILSAASYWKSTSSFASFLMTILAADLYSLAISVKMNALLYLPGFLLVVYLLCDENLLKMSVPLCVGILVQIMTGFKFLLPLDDSPEASEIRWNYIDQAFNFKRKFLYTWTVNWRFLSEEFFLSEAFHHTLLILHVAVLLAFFVTFVYKHVRTSLRTTKNLIIDSVKVWKSTLPSSSIIVDSQQGPKFVFVVMALTNLIGVLFARSLHYQFLAWYAHTLPGLLLLNKFPAICNIVLFGLNEYAWNTYPSTQISSAILIFVLSATIAGVWLNVDMFNSTSQKLQEKDQHLKLKKEQ